MLVILNGRSSKRQVVILNKERKLTHALLQILLKYSNLWHSSICRIIVEVVNRLWWIVIVSLHLFANRYWQMANSNISRLLTEQINTKNLRLLNWALIKFEVLFRKVALSFIQVMGWILYFVFNLVLTSRGILTCEWNFTEANQT